MQDVPKFVVKRLKEAAPAGEHPDADLLSAFAERSLAGREREGVMEHLALCGDCRDVVALALPESEIAAVPSVKSSSTGWLRWPGLSWGVAAAGILAVTLVGVLQYAHQNERKMVASNQMQEGLAAPVGVSQPAPSQVVAPQAERKKQASDALGSQTLTARTTAGRAIRGDEAKSGARHGGGSGGGMGVASGSEGGVVAGESGRLVAGGEAQNAVPEVQRQVSVGAASEAVKVEGPRNQIAQNEPALALGSRKSADWDVVKAKNPVAGQSASATPPRLVAPGPSQTSSALMVRGLPRWTVSAAGGLQRSFDGGSTWEDVNPALNGAAIGGSFAKEGSAKADAARFSQTEPTQAKQSRKVSAVANPALVFRSVAASGLEVWAGGSGGALYHSADGGNSWSRVTPSSDGVALTGDVVSIEFLDPQHGNISTSNAEMWTTSDSGHSWRRQR